MSNVPGALKYDGDKPMMDLVFDGIPSVLLGMGHVLTYGFRKYKGKHGWKALDDAIKRYEAAMIRHMLLKAQGEVFDAESELPHAWHIATNAAFIAELEYTKGMYNAATKS
jgi:hypothetical protein